MITYTPIGYVHNHFDKPVAPGLIREGESRIVLAPEFAGGLKGVEPGHQLVVVFHFHLSDGYELLQHPRHDPARPPRGVFALRSPRRPNPIGITTVELVSIEGNVLFVRDLDAINGTPVLDLKPA